MRAAAIALMLLAIGLPGCARSVEFMGGPKVPPEFAWKCGVAAPVPFNPSAPRIAGTEEDARMRAAGCVETVR